MGKDPVSPALSCFRPGVHQRAIKREVIGFDALTLLLSLGHNQHIAVLRALIAAGLIVVITGRFARQTRVGRKSGEKKRAPCVVRTLHTVELCDGVVSRARPYITPERRERQKK